MVKVGGMVATEERVAITLAVNGRDEQVSVEPRWLLSDVLRRECGLKGVHVGCEHGVCGACTVTIDGSLARSCLTPTVQVDGSEVRTVEGLAPHPARLSILQEAFRRNHALQCGFCTPGILMSLDVYLSRHSNPSESDIRDLLSGHLCRCTGYTPIVRAALDAAAKLANPPLRGDDHA